LKTAKLLAIVGSKNSGKTTTAECIISGLTRKGFRVGSIKHIRRPDFTIDTEGTNTWRHSQAGSEVVAAIAKNETDLIVKDDPETILPLVLKLMERQELDVIVIEGLHSSLGQRSDVFKIVTAHDTKELRGRLRETPPPIVAVTGIVSEQASQLTDIGIPVFDSRADCQRLVQRIEDEVIRR